MGFRELKARAAKAQAWTADMRGQLEDAAAEKTARADARREEQARRQYDRDAARLGGARFDAGAGVLHLKGRNVQVVRRQGGISGMLAYGGIGAISRKGYDDVRRFGRGEEVTLPLRFIVSVGSSGTRASVVASDGREFRFYLGADARDELAAAAAGAAAQLAGTRP